LASPLAASPLAACVQVKIPKTIGSEERKLMEQLRDLQVSLCVVMSEPCMLLAGSVCSSV